MRTASLSFVLLVSVLGLTGCSSCGGKAPSRDAGVAAVRGRQPERRREVEEGEEDGPVVDEEGRLLESDDRYGRFPIPLAFADEACVRETCSYEAADVPVAQLDAYVEARLATETVQAIGSSGAKVYRNATVREVEMDGHVLDVFVSPKGEGSELRIADHVLPPDLPRDEASRLHQVQQALEAEQRE